MSKNMSEVRADANDSFCETKWEGNRSSFCCFKGSMFGKCLPSFIIAGTQKSGTTALAATLSSHPQVSFAKRKELRFFDRRKQFKKGITHYLDSFRFWNFSRDPAILPHFAEATPFYLASRHACRRISETVPEVRLVVLLREPVARAYSEYQMKKRRVDSQNEFITLAHQHALSLHNCLLRNPHQWSAVEACVPPSLGQHEHWTRLSSAVGRVLREVRTRKQEEEGWAEGYEGEGDDRSSEEGLEGGTSLRVWAEMLLSCFSPTPEQYWEEKKQGGERKRAHSSSSSLLQPVQQSESVHVNSSLSGAIASRSSPLNLSPLCHTTADDSFCSPPQQQWQQQWQWVSEQYAHPERDLGSDNRLPLFNLSSWKTRRDAVYFQPLACLGSHARETLLPLAAAFELELRALKACSGGEFLRGSLEQMDAGLETCLTVHSGISDQYLYRSLYGVQIQHCLKYIPRDRMLFVPSEALKSKLSSEATLLKIKKFLNISVFESAREARLSQEQQLAEKEQQEALQSRVDEKFPGFERSSGWRLESQYDPLPGRLRRHLTDFFRAQNDKLFNLLGEDYLAYWSGGGT